MSLLETDENIPPPFLKPNGIIDSTLNPTTSSTYNSDEDSQLPPISSNFNWTRFMKENSTLPAEWSKLGLHAEHLVKTLAEIVFSPGCNVMVGHHPDMIPAIMKSLVGDIAFVEFFDENSCEEVKVDQLVLPINPMKLSGFAKDNIAGIPHSQMEKLSDIVSSFIKPGHYFEYVDPLNPQFTKVLKVIDNKNGFVRAIDVKGNSFTTFMGWNWCKRLGFSLLPENEGEFSLEPYMGVTVGSTIPWYVFCGRFFRKHKLEVGSVLEVLDPVTRFRLVPAVVIEIVNKYFFRIQLVTSATGTEQGVTMICHRDSPDIFPANYASKNNLRLSAPDGVDESSYSIYQMKMQLVNSNQISCADPSEKVDLGRHVEVYDQDKDAFYPATILRQYRHLLVLRFEHDKSMSLPKVYSYNHEHIFKVGSAELYGRPLLCREPYIDRHIWKYENPHNTTANVLNSEEPNRRFMVRAFSDSTQFLPTLYVNQDCYKGPFLHTTKPNWLDASIPPSHFQPLMYLFINEFMEILAKTEYQKICEASSYSRAPKYKIQLPNPRSDNRYRNIVIEVCEKASEFPGWLRQFLLKYDICPNFISPVKREPGQECPFKCDRFKNASHLNVPNSVPKNVEASYRRQIPPKDQGNAKKRDTSDRQIQRSAENFTDLDQPLGVRRTRRNIIPTKRKEMQDEMHDNLRQYFQAQRKRDASNVSDKDVNEPAKRKVKRNDMTNHQRSHSQGYEDVQPESHQELMEIVNRIDGRRITANQVRLNTSGPRVLLPQKSRSPTGPVESPPPVLSRSPSISRVSSASLYPTSSNREFGNGRESPTEAERICLKYGVGDVEPREWTGEMLCQVVRKAKLDTVADWLEEQEFDGEAFLLMTEEDLRERLKLKQGPLMKTLNLLKELKVLSPDMPNLIN